jgi:hypothetical protein
LWCFAPTHIHIPLCSPPKLALVPERLNMPKLRVLNIIHLPQIHNDLMQRLFIALPLLSSLKVATCWH